MKFRSDKLHKWQAELLKYANSLFTNDILTYWYTDDVIQEQYMNIIQWCLHVTPLEYAATF